MILGVSLETLAGLVLPGLATGVGGLVLLAIRHPGDRLLDGLLGFTGGIMVSASVFSLIVPALESGSILEIVGGLAGGAALLLLLDRVFPHLHARFSERGGAQGRRAALLLSAMTIHNLPEGLAVGVAYAAGGPELGLPVAVAIAVQNVPEGFASAAPLIGAGASVRTAIAFAAATGLVEPPAALLGYGVVSLAGAVLPAALAFAAGAMLYVVVDELIPESHARGNERDATLGFLGGFVVMLVLDNALG
jgi:ZIP family zinc transporter